MQQVTSYFIWLNKTSSNSDSIQFYVKFNADENMCSHVHVCHEYAGTCNLHLTYLKNDPYITFFNMQVDRILFCYAGASISFQKL